MAKPGALQMNFRQVKKSELLDTCHVGELHVSPASLLTTFGEPCGQTSDPDCIGEYYFISDDGKCFVVYLVHPDPVPEDLDDPQAQFWALADPVPFSIGAPHESDVEEFKHWIQMQIRLGE